MSTLINFLTALVLVYTILIFLYILMSWVQLPYNVWIGRVRTFLHDTVEPYLGLFRRIIPPLGGLDLSPVVALIVLQLAYQIITSVLRGFE
ncbi:MAG TPA: YggT family protein [Gaiellales bacterium]|nr:YggT family protein [Gaiellales bacterium]